MWKMNRLVPALLVTAGIVAGCDDDPADPDDLTAAAIAGDYRAEEDLGAYRLITVTDGEETDWLEQGAAVTLVLNADGTTEGTLFVPGANEDGSDFEADLAGTFTIDDDVVEFEHESDTFIRDMPFTWEDGVLYGDRTFGDTRVILELVRQ